MKTWHYIIPSLSPDQIRDAVRDDKWQDFRLSLKGLSTEKKLDRLEWYLMLKEHQGEGFGVIQTRVANYINALLRGGQLKRNKNGTIKVQR